MGGDPDSPVIETADGVLDTRKGVAASNSFEGFMVRGLNAEFDPGFPGTRATFEEIEDRFREAVGSGCDHDHVEIGCDENPLEQGLQLLDRCGGRRESLEIGDQTGVISIAPTDVVDSGFDLILDLHPLCQMAGAGTQSVAEGATAFSGNGVAIRACDSQVYGNSEQGAPVPLQQEFLKKQNFLHVPDFSRDVLMYSTGQS
jgi:hypothetical protein